MLRELKGRQTASTVEFTAQVNFGSPAFVERISTVAFSGATGYLIAHDEPPVNTLHPGDRITHVNGAAVDWRIGELVPQGTYPGVWTLLYIPFFEDRG